MKLFSKNSIPKHLTYDRFDIFRDGGSIAVSFLDAKGNRYEMMFPISKMPIESEYKTYNAPILTIWLKAAYVSKVTGIETPQFEKTQSTIIWSEATKLLIKNVTEEQVRNSDYPWVFAAMLNICQNNGKLIEANT